MTSQEFIAKLSPAAHEMMTRYQFKETKPLELHITNNEENPCYMVYDNPDSYPVYINADFLGPAAEVKFMHQFCHCVQMEEHFPTVKCIDDNDNDAKTLAAAINSIVLDMYVNSVMKRYGYVQNKNELLKNYTELTYRFRYFKENHIDVSKLGNKYSEYLYGVSIASVYFDCDTKKARELQKDAMATSANIRQYAGTLINVIKAYDFNSAIGCHYIFDHLLSDLKLTDILYVKPGEGIPTEEASQE